MSEEADKIIDSIDGFLDKKKLALESKYFLVEKLRQIYLKEIIDPEDDSVEGDESDFDDFELPEESEDDSVDDDEPEDSEEVDDVEDIEDVPEDIPEPKVPKIPQKGHQKSIRSKLIKRSKSAIKKPKVPVKD